MSRFKKLSHTIYECKFHVVWIPKYRYRVMTGDIRAYVHNQLRRLCDWKKLEIIEMNVQVDHVHIVQWIPPNFAVSQVVGFLKGKTALRIMDKFPSLRKRYWTKHFWSPGYCVTSRFRNTYGGSRKKIRIRSKLNSKIFLESNNQHTPFRGEIKATAYGRGLLLIAFSSFDELRMSVFLSNLFKKRRS